MTPRIDGVADRPDVAVAIAVGAHVARRGEARARRLFLHVLDGEQHGGFGRFRRACARIEHVGMRVDQTGKNGALAQIDHFGSRGEFFTWPSAPTSVIRSPESSTTPGASASGRSCCRTSCVRRGPPSCAVRADTLYKSPPSELMQGAVPAPRHGAGGGWDWAKSVRRGRARMRARSRWISIALRLPHG